MLSDVYTFFAMNATTKQYSHHHQVTHSDGLSRAHQEGDYAFIGDTLYIEGTHTNRDRYADIKNFRQLDMTCQPYNIFIMLCGD